MGKYLAIKVNPEEYQHFAVQDEVYVYVRQLEECIKHPDQSKLKELYPERFPWEENENEPTNK